MYAPCPSFAPREKHGGNLGRLCYTHTHYNDVYSGQGRRCMEARTMTLFLVLTVLALAAFWRQVAALLGVSLLILLALGVAKVAELLHMGGS
jgi:hypothetical protein